MFVAVAGDGTNRVMTSTDCITWTVRSASIVHSWRRICYGNGLFVAVANDGTSTDKVMTSSDGITWTTRTSVGASDIAWHGVAYGNGTFVAVAQAGTGNRVMSSPDGITWTLRTESAHNGWLGVVYANGLFVAVGGSATTNGVMTSPDGITWTGRTTAEANAWISVAYGAGLFVAVAYSGTNRVMTSPDGITWTARSASQANSWYDVTFGTGLFVAIAGDGTNRVMTSPDGITWTNRSAAAANGWYAITYGNGLFVAVGFTGTGNRVMTSPNGTTWTTRTSAQNNAWYGVAYAEMPSEAPQGALSTIKAFWHFGDAFNAEQLIDSSGNNNHLSPNLRLSPETCQFRIGGNSNTSGNFSSPQQAFMSLKGMGKWDRLLTAAEKAALANKEYWPFSATTSLQDVKAYYLLDEAGGSSTYSDSKGLNHLTAAGTTVRVAGPNVTDYGTRLCTSTDFTKFTGSMSGTVLTVTAMTEGTIQVGMELYGNLDDGVLIVSFGTGSGGTGTYNLNVSRTLSSRTIWGTNLINLTKVSPTVELQSSGTTMTIAGWVKMHYKPNDSNTQFQQSYWGQLINTTIDVGFNPAYDPTADRFACDLGGGDSGGLEVNCVLIENSYGSPPLNTWLFVLWEYDANVNNEVSVAVNDGTKTIYADVIQPLPVAGKKGLGSKFLLNTSFSFSPIVSGRDTSEPNGICFASKAQNADLLFGDNAKTVWGWFKADNPSLAEGQTMAGFYDGNAANTDWLIYLYSNYLYFSFGAGNLYAAVPVTDTNWHFFIAWYNKTTRSIHLNLDNGAYTWSSGAVTAQSTTLAFKVGADSSTADGMGDQFRGVLNLWGIANGNPTPAEIATLWNGGNGWEYTTRYKELWWERQRERSRVGGRR